MIDQSKGKIFLAGERGHTETAWFRSYNTFNFGHYQNEHKAPFGSLYVFNDDTLAGGSSFTLYLKEDSYIILLPTVGAITYTDNNGVDSLIEAGQAKICAVSKNANFKISNPYKNTLVNFLQIWIKKLSGENKCFQQVSFDLENNKNVLLDLFASYSETGASIKASIGKFHGREETTYTIKGFGKSVFVFVLEGAFEVQYRLLETRDGLALWNVEKIEVESLSDNAILLILEIGSVPATLR